MKKATEKKLFDTFVTAVTMTLFCIVLLPHFLL